MHEPTLPLATSAELRRLLVSALEQADAYDALVAAYVAQALALLNERCGDQDLV